MMTSRGTRTLKRVRIRACSVFNVTSAACYAQEKTTVYENDEWTRSTRCLWKQEGEHII